MLEILLVIFILMAIITMMVAFYERDPVFALVSAVLWLISALGSFQIEYPYEMYNATSSAIETGVHTIEPVAATAYIFMILGIIMFFSFLALVFELSFGKDKE